MERCDSLECKPKPPRPAPESTDSDTEGDGEDGASVDAAPSDDAPSDDGGCAFRNAAGIRALVEACERGGGAPWVAGALRERNLLKALEATRRAVGDAFDGAEACDAKAAVSARLAGALAATRRISARYCAARCAVLGVPRDPDVALGSDKRRVEAETNLVRAALAQLGAGEVAFGFAPSLAPAAFAVDAGRAAPHEYPTPSFEGKAGARTRDPDASGDAADAPPPPAKKSADETSPSGVHALILEDCDEIAEAMPPPGQGGFDFSCDPLFAFVDLRPAPALHASCGRSLAARRDAEAEAATPPPGPRPRFGAPAVADAVTGEVTDEDPTKAKTPALF